LAVTGSGRERTKYLLGSISQICLHGATSGGSVPCRSFIHPSSQKVPYSITYDLQRWPEVFLPTDTSKARHYGLRDPGSLVIRRPFEFHRKGVTQERHK